MKEEYVSLAELEANEREEKIVKYEDGGSSAIIVDEPGETVDLYRDKHKYLVSPEKDPMSKISISGYTEQGEKVKLVVDQNYLVAFGVDARGKQFVEVSHPTTEDYEALRQPLVIGEESKGFPSLIVTSVGAEYKAFGGGASDDNVEPQNPFEIAKRLVERAKKQK